MFVIALLAGYALLVTAMVFFGLVMIHVLLPLGGLGADDEDFNDSWLTTVIRTEHASWVGSTLAGGLVIPVVIGVCLVTFLLMRRWLLAAFILFVVAVESATYGVTSMIVERQRPDVPRLESLPVDVQPPLRLSDTPRFFIASYGGLLLPLASGIDNTVVRVLALVVGIAIPRLRRVVAGLSRDAPLQRLGRWGAARSRSPRCARFRLSRGRGGDGASRPHRRGRRLGMSSVAVVAHAGKSTGGGLGEPARCSRGPESPTRSGRRCQRASTHRSGSKRRLPTAV